MSLSKRLISTDAAGAADGSANFDTVLYTGNSGAQSISSLSFSPDLVWIKKRSSAQQHVLTDTVRGIGSSGGANIIYTDSDEVESTNADTSFLSSFDSNGFTLGSSTYYNASSETYVAWCWKGGGSAVSNTNGTITSTVSANAAAGFSIVKYSGNSTTGATVGHGLTSPQMVIIKCTSTGSTNWILYADPLGNSNYLTLNNNTQQATYSNWFYSNATTFTLNQTFGNANTSSRDYMAYCFSDVAGYQKIGSYTGNGNSTGTVVTTGFRPRFVMIKSTDQTGDWIIVDSTRNPSNPADKRIDANSVGQEQTDTIMDLNSDGFQLKTSSAAKNGLDKVFIYWAIA